MSRPYSFNRRDFKAIQSLVYERAGIALSASKDAMVYSRLSRRLRVLSLSTFGEYIEYLSDNDHEMQLFIDALTTNKTAFFREEHHFSFLKDWLAKQSTSVTIWCAASSSGEEPYSIAMTCEDAFRKTNLGYEVFASDINTAMLDKARQASYSIEMLEAIPKDYVKRYCQKGKNKNAGLFRVHPTIYANTHFFHQNLLDNSWSLPTKLDIIFCRNVMIYFDKATQTKLLKRFAEKLKPGGLYFAGHSESVMPLCDHYSPLGHTIYQKVSG
ncbi:chemotaxis protein CheR [Alteromonas sediminis]|uniref:Chemotaxis protein methyltransferase n=1 Tax=Alteromonas sediminis TaxID=2259342 RepID=A0A3N5YQT0_9ALTE|nr:CheR family methyltransferase [Alteromonas sediminis]RPJ68601.1 chemotaxis protein CheR [Alteromonas sediminis]